MAMDRQKKSTRTAAQLFKKLRPTDTNTASFAFTRDPSRLE